MNATSRPAAFDSADPDGRLPTGIPRELTSKYVMSARLSAVIRILDGSPDLGPLVALQGGIALAGMSAHLIFHRRPHGKADAPEQMEYRIPLVVAGQVIRLRGHRVRGEAGVSELLLSLTDHERGRLSGEPLMMQPVSGTREIEIPFVARTQARLWVTAVGSSGRTGPRVRVNGELGFQQGVTAHLGLHYRIRGPAGRHEDSCEIPLVRPGFFVCARERTVEPGAPDTGWLAVQFAEPDGKAIGEEHSLGRLTST